ncbi:alpha-galactosidase 5 precursor [Rhizoctonia solani AG-1 IA]|uniref:alpha-galactosidase n=1 Tax=Thanatephorus cucumeris (strain AG1-IA) TaxID=983506 RepID=L8WP31_THACA|nr:alpha-galactosidase 5 precursor [Rhizoctonia solani AG-1 IA]
MPKARSYITLRAMYHLKFLPLLLAATGALALDNGLSRTPALGFNGYNTNYKTTADQLVSLGLKDVGYQYLNIDCGWQGTARNSSGAFTWNTALFPSGIPSLVNYVHQKGLKFGLYGDAGCVLPPRYRCNATGEFKTPRAGSLRGTHGGCRSNDIADGWDHVVRIINEVFPITGFARPGAWNDLDMLEVGNKGMTIEEQKTHFAFWAAAKSPLLIGTNLATISSDALAILKNPRLLAVNQDSLGKSIGLQRRYAGDKDVWSGPLADGSTVVIVINWQNSARSLSFNLADIGASSANVIDLWTGSNLGKLNGSYTANIAAHGSFALKLSSIQVVIPPTFTYYAAASPSNTLSGGANTRVVNSTITMVGYVGNGAGTLKFNNIDGGAGGTKLVAFDYIHADWTMSNTACSNCRNAYVSVNGGTAVQVQFPISGMTWDILYSGFKVSLSGFQSGKNNIITITNPSAYAPDFYRIGIAN